MKRINSNLARTDGFSLVEVLVAGALGLLLLAGVISVFSGSRVTYRTQEQLANVQTDGRFALLYLENMIQNSGWYDGIPTEEFDDALAIYGEDNSTLGGTSDLVRPRMFNITSGRDCNGEAISDDDITNEIYVDGDSLVCDGNGDSGPQPIIENVESFQVLYGVDTTSNGLANQFVTASDVTDFNRVVAVKIGLLIVTEEISTNEAIERTYNVLDETVETNDARLRRLFTATISLPNQAYPLVRSL